MAYKKIVERFARTRLLQTLALHLIRVNAKPTILRRDLEVFLLKFPAGTPGVHFKINFLRDYCRNKKIAHLGFVDYPFTKESFLSPTFMHAQLKEVASSVIGLDNNAEAVDFYKKQTQDELVHVADIYELSHFKEELKSCTVFLLGEILEHLDNPGGALQSIRTVMPEDARLIITVPNALSLNLFGCALHDIELVHPDHVAWYSPNTLNSLVKRHGFIIDQLCFYQSGEGDEVDAFYQKYPFLSEGIIGIFKKT